MKIQIDSNKYLTGNYCKVGSIDNAIEMDSLPDSDPIYYTAYKLLSREIQKTITVMEEVTKYREVVVPILDGEGNDTGETETKQEPYVVMEPVEKSIPVTEYYYELDTAKKTKIDEDLNNLPVEKPIDIKELSNQVTDMQLSICDIYESLGVI